MGKILEIESQENGVYILHLQPGRMDMILSYAFDKELKDFLKRNPKNVILDLSLTEFIDSSSFAIIRKFSNDMQERGGKLILCNIAPPIRNVLKLSKIDILLDIADDLKSAKALLT